jgi:hypothetical protein
MAATEVLLASDVSTFGNDLTTLSADLSTLSNSLASLGADVTALNTVISQLNAISATLVSGIVPADAIAEVSTFEINGTVESDEVL